MEYTVELFKRFVNEIVRFDTDTKGIVNEVPRFVFASRTKKYETEKFRGILSVQSKGSLDRFAKHIKDTRNNMAQVVANDIILKQNVFNRLEKCKEYVSIIESSKNLILKKGEYEAIDKSNSGSASINIDDILSGKINFCNLAYKVQLALEDDSQENKKNVCSEFFNTTTVAQELLNREIMKLRAESMSSIDKIHKNFDNINRDYCDRNVLEWESNINNFKQLQNNYEEAEKNLVGKAVNNNLGEIKNYKQNSSTVFQKFCDNFSPEEFRKEYEKLYFFEQSYDKYQCQKYMPQNVYISNIEYDLSSLNINKNTRQLLDSKYYFLFDGKKISFPFCVSFSSELNYLFKFSGDDRANVVKASNDLGMRLFMMVPPGKINFTFIDPVTLGESFAMFTRLVDVDDRTSEIINGKIWSSSQDIEEKLRIMTDHISNVTQRCLQGKFENIYEYNLEAEQNAEPYQILMLMDYPTGLTERALKYLEQIVTSGPKCGVFTIIYRNESQYNKVSDKLYPLIENIESNFQKFTFTENGKKIIYSDLKIKNRPLMWANCLMPTGAQLDSVIACLKKGIKNADKIVVDIEKLNKAIKSDEQGNTADGIKIPIGIRGANEIQYLTLGVGGSHHALIAGIAGSGKSSLLHTIILQALSQYGPEELQIYLVDFKRGVEFKIYADYRLPTFEVVAIESEREFGYNILKALEREQKIRADKFKKVKEKKIDKIENYRALGKKMPRILVIMDEFHELFADANDQIGRESAEMMERIVRQGRAFGVHIILSSQSYSNVGGLDKSVYEQMTVRIVLKCSKTDAAMLLAEGSSDIDQISINEPGRAIYNSEAGNKEYNSHFRVAYIQPSNHRGILEKVSQETCGMSDKETRILLSNIEDNKYCIFNQYENYTTDMCDVLGRLYIGELLSVENKLRMELGRNKYSNMLMVGSDTDKARNMFTFTMLSLAINYWVSHGKVSPKEPFIYFLNYKPLRDSYFVDIPGIISKELLNKYIKNIPVHDEKQVKDIIKQMYDSTKDDLSSNSDVDKFIMVFGYQRAEDLKSEEKEENKNDILSMMSTSQKEPKCSTKEMVETILTQGGKKGIHAIFWQDDFSALDLSDRKLMTYFYQKIAFDMKKEEYSQFVGVNDISHLSENTAVYSNRIDDTVSFRPYQTPDTVWIEEICKKLNV